MRETLGDQRSGADLVNVSGAFDQSDRFTQSAAITTDDAFIKLMDYLSLIRIAQDVMLYSSSPPNAPLYSQAPWSSNARGLDLGHCAGDPDRRTDRLAC